MVGLLLVAGVVTPGASDPATLIVDTQKIVTPSFMGLGVQWDPFDYQLTDKQWQRVESRINYMNPGIFRVCVASWFYIQGLDDAGNPIYAWNSGRRDHHFDQLFKILDYAQKHKVTVLLGEWGCPGKISAGSGSTEIKVQDPRWPRMIADFLDYLRNKRGYTCIRYYNFVNEPNGDWSGNESYETWETGMRSLAGELKKHKLDQKITLVGPDATVTSAWRDGFGWADKVAARLSDFVGAYDLHWYAFDEEVRDGSIERVLSETIRSLRKSDPNAAHKPFMVCESGILTGKTNGDQQPRVRTFEYGVMMADYLTQVANSGWMTAIAWDLDDAMHINKGPQTPIPGSDTLKVWGFWNSLGSAMGRPEDEHPRPWFYVWSVTSRLFPAKSVIVGASRLEKTPVRSTTGCSPDGKQLSMMLVNDSTTSQEVLVRVPGRPAGDYKLYRYTEGNLFTNADGLAMPAETQLHLDIAKGWQIMIPAQSVLWLTTGK